MDSEESHKPKKTHRGWWIAAGIVLLTVAIVALLWFSGQWSLQRKIEALHAKGFPISFEEIEQKRRLPEGTPNAADLYQQAFDAFQQPSAQDLPLLPYFGSGKLPEPGIPLSSDMLNAIERFVVANQKTRSFLEQATDQSYCALPVGCSTPPLPGLDYLEPIYKCGRLLFLNGIRQIEISDFQGAMNTIRNLRYVGNSLCRQPLLQDFVYQRNFVFRNILLVERFLNRGTISEEMLIELNDVLDRNIMPQMAIDAHRNEMPFLMAGLKNPAIYYRTNNLYDNLIIRSNTEECLDIVERLVEICSLEPVERYKKIMEVKKKGDKLSAFYHPVSKTEIVALIDNLLLDLRVGVLIDSSRTAIAVERFRLETGKLPERLEDLVPKYMEKVSIDPFDGKPLHFKHLEKGYTIYSIGEDGKDDGGKKRNPLERDFDYPFTVRR